ITMSYGGYTAKAYVTVDNVTNNSNRYIKSLTVDNSLTCGIEDSSLVTIKTSNMPDGTILYPVVDSGLTVSGSCRVYNNTASFYVYSTKTTGVGSYNVSISYGGTNTSVIVNVVTGKGTLKNISVANSLTYGISSSTAVTVTTMNVPDGTVLYPTINGSLSTTASCQVYNNQATFYVYNFPMTAVGNYTMTISLMGDVSSATVTVATASSNPYIANVSVDNKIVAGTNSYATITLATTNIANGTSLYPSVDNGLSISGLCIVNNNTAVFTIHADSSTVAGSYIVTIPYGNYTTTTTLIIN
ncbi:hypothetical protein LJB89_02885, partial [Tyzzerella sp. OttesenSCG-928-J15]|nr:hypothetical protein [Tyzzerella sp. OttesenSCG-928-J15]